MYSGDIYKHAPRVHAIHPLSTSILVASLASVYLWPSSSYASLPNDCVGPPPPPPRLLLLMGTSPLQVSLVSTSDSKAYDLFRSIRLRSIKRYTGAPLSGPLFRLNFHLVPIRIPHTVFQLGCKVSPLVRSTFFGQNVDLIPRAPVY